MDQHNNNKNSIDDIDQRIIEALQQDGRRPFTKIAADLGISEASVRQRVSNLINNQVMQIVAVTNPIKLGFSLASMIGICVSGDRLMEAAQEISAFDEVIYLILCTGSFDMLAEVVCRDNDHLLNFLTEKLYKVPGVQQAETYMYLRVCKDTGTVVRLISLEVKLWGIADFHPARAQSHPCCAAKNLFYEASEVHPYAPIKMVRICN